jgi:predicted alpha/beta-hydrolase family hydrolase
LGNGEGLWILKIVVALLTMKTETISLPVSPSIGSVTAEYLEPDNMKAMFVFAHGAGAGMDHPFMTSLSHELATRNIGSLRFNFPFTEQKKKRPDVPAVAHKTIEAAIEKAKALFPNTPVFASGKSFGGRMTSQYVAKQKLDGVKGLVFVGFPLHPPGKPGTERADHLQDVQLPMLFLQGTRDELAKWELIEPVVSSLAPATLIKIEGADHGFKIPRQNSIPLLASHIADWMVSLT